MVEQTGANPTTANNTAVFEQIIDFIGSAQTVWGIVVTMICVACFAYFVIRFRTRIKTQSDIMIKKFTRENNIVPNLTTSGFQITQNEVNLIKKYCGAVAVSYYSNLKNGKETNPITINAIKMLISAGCKTNIHYVISKKNIEEVI